jgi:hypothetical protein
MPKALDLTGQRFGRLVALERRRGSRKEAAAWLCRCDCGAEKWVVTELLRSGTTRSCGCLHKEQLSERRSVKEEAGTRYGKLVVVGPAGKGGDHGGRLLWFCQCDCGRQTVVEGKKLRNGNTQSCGCGIAEAITAAHAIDIAGQRFGRLVAVKPVVGARFANGKAKRQWEFLCDCGNTTVSTVAMVRWGNTRSCGCLMREQSPLNFHNEGHRAYAEDPDYASRPSLLYFVEVAHTCEKIGIAFDLEKRSRGDYTEKWWTKEMPRAFCWAVEQVALHLTREFAALDLPKELCVGGVTEFRQGLEIDETIDLLEELSEEAMEVGWREFYDKHLL